MKKKQHPLSFPVSAASLTLLAGIVGAGAITIAANISMIPDMDSWSAPAQHIEVPSVPDPVPVPAETIVPQAESVPAPSPATQDAPSLLCSLLDVCPTENSAVSPSITVPSLPDAPAPSENTDGTWKLMMPSVPFPFLNPVLTFPPSYELHYFITVPPVLELNRPDQCHDSFNNDGDDFTDQFDPDCQQQTMIEVMQMGLASCYNGLDDDGDSKIDEAETECQHQEDTVNRRPPRTR